MGGKGDKKEKNSILMVNGGDDEMCA